LEEVKTMKSATTVVALVLTLLVWVFTASAWFVGEIIVYNIPTPAPDGVVSCTLLVSGDNPDPNAFIRVFVAVDNSSNKTGEAQIPEVGIGDGIQPGCDIFPEGPYRTDRRGIIAAKDIAVNLGAFFFDWRLQVHGHPDSDCTLAGNVQGNVAVSLIGPVVYADTPDPVMYLVCE
jgi:hypothetical protein